MLGKTSCHCQRKEHVGKLLSINEITCFRRKSKVVMTIVNLDRTNSVCVYFNLVQFTHTQTHKVSKKDKMRKKNKDERNRLICRRANKTTPWSMCVCVCVCMCVCVCVCVWERERESFDFYFFSLLFIVHLYVFELSVREILFRGNKA